MVSAQGDADQPDRWYLMGENSQAAAEDRVSTPSSGANSLSCPGEGVGSDSIELRDVRSSDAQQVYELAASVHAEREGQLLKSRWVWQYESNPRGAPGQVVAAVRDNTIIAILCGIGQRFWINGQEHSGVWLADFMAYPVPGAVGRSVASALARHQTIKHPLSLGHQRPAITRYWQRLRGKQGAKKICEANVLALPLRVSPFIADKLPRGPLGRWLGALADFAVRSRAGFRSRRALSEYSFESAKTCGAEFDDFWNSAKVGYPALAVRDRAYVDWRYLQAPNRDYQLRVARVAGSLVGWVVYRVVPETSPRQVRIVDMLVAPEKVDVAKHLLAGTVREVVRRPVDVVKVVETQIPWMALAHTAVGFVKRGQSNLGADYTGTPADGIAPDFFYDPSNWYFSYGDGDTDMYGP